MDYIKGFTFGWGAKKGVFRTPEARRSLELLKERTGIDTVIMALYALQDTAQSVEIDYAGLHMVDDDELIDMIKYAKELGLRVVLKPTVNVRNGTWRAHINFFDKDVVCEPKWSQWFASYTAYQVHYAKIAQATGCEMLCVGCEMVQTDRRADEWRALIAEVREHYGGPVTYNCDKYQEDNITWWDAVDVISASGYYPINDWDNQLDRIEKVVWEHGKPFFFIEAGCPSRTGSAMVPNDWGLPGDVSMKEQADFYKIMFEKCGKRDWVGGFGLWDWSATLHKLEDAEKNDGYGVYGKPAEKVIREFYTGK